jgi:hypothetical protein
MVCEKMLNKRFLAIFSLYSDIVTAESALVYVWQVYVNRTANLGRVIDYSKFVLLPGMSIVDVFVYTSCGTTATGFIGLDIRFAM